MIANTVSVDNSSHPIAAQILVQDTTGPVAISNITVDGTNNQIGGCAPDLEGILFQNASGTLTHVAVRNQTLGSGLGGCQSGEGIFVQSASGSTSTVSVLDSSVHNYNKNGITGNDVGTTLTVMGNYVQGAGVVPVPGAAQNGIQLAFGATGKIIGNTVIDNIYGDPVTAASADILLYDTAANSGVSVSTNTLGNSQLPIGLFAASPGGGDGVSVTSNKIFGTSTYDGIDVCTNGNTIKTNTITNSAESGVHLDASCGSTGSNNVVSGNAVFESFCAGLLTDPGVSGNTTSPNTYYTVPFTLTSSTARCTIPVGAMRARSTRRFSPAR
jgi:parallel beta-helix repeat protein